MKYLTSLKDITLGLFLTRGVSLSDWDKIGILKREIAPYNLLAKHFKKIIIFSYGSEDLRFKRYLADNIEIVQKNVKIPNKIYSLILPIIHRNKVRMCDILKTNQIRGAYAAVISKLLFRKRIIIRSGYVGSLMMRQNKENLIKRYILSLEEFFAYRTADRIIVASKINKEYLKKRYSFAKNDIQAINNMIDTSIFRPLKMKKTKNTILYVGRIEERQKNLSMLIEAMKGLGINLIMVGKGSKENMLKELAMKNDVSLKMIDKMDNYELPALLNKADIFVLPSLH